MIHLLVGPNSYKMQQVIAEQLKDVSPDAVERREGAELTVAHLPDLLQGISLFISERVIILKETSTNKAVWEALGEWLGTLSSETQLILIEPTVDKRTKTFKQLQKVATVVVCDEVNEVQAAQWVSDRATQAGQTMPVSTARLLVEYVGTDQWRLAHELEKLLLADDLSAERIKATVDAQPQANAFALLDAVFARNLPELRRLLRDCETQEDAYRLFGLLANQIFQLAAVARAGTRTAEQIAKDIGAHPYPIKKLKSVAARLTSAEVTRAVEAVAQLDDQLKRTVADPWLLIEQSLVKIATKA